jgi:hypothetical protein
MIESIRKNEYTIIRKNNYKLDSERQEDDICGLDSTRKNAFEKMKEITNNTTLKLAFEKIGLEVAE